MIVKPQKMILIEPVGIETSTYGGSIGRSLILIEPVGIETGYY